VLHNERRSSSACASEYIARRPHERNLSRSLCCHKTASWFS
jgi:hypothetical protein